MYETPAGRPKIIPDPHTARGLTVYLNAALSAVQQGGPAIVPIERYLKYLAPTASDTEHTAYDVLHYLEDLGRIRIVARGKSVDVEKLSDEPIDESELTPTLISCTCVAV